MNLDRSLPAGHRPRAVVGAALVLLACVTAMAEPVTITLVRWPYT